MSDSDSNAGHNTSSPLASANTRCRSDSERDRDHEQQEEEEWSIVHATSMSESLSDSTRGAERERERRHGSNGSGRRRSRSSKDSPRSRSRLREVRGSRARGTRSHSSSASPVRSFASRGGGDPSDAKTNSDRVMSESAANQSQRSRSRSRAASRHRSHSRSRRSAPTAKRRSSHSRSASRERTSRGDFSRARSRSGSRSSRSRDRSRKSRSRGSSRRRRTAAAAPRDSSRASKSSAPAAVGALRKSTRTRTRGGMYQNAPLPPSPTKRPGSQSPRSSVPSRPSATRKGGMYEAAGSREDRTSESRSQRTLRSAAGRGNRPVSASRGGMYEMAGPSRSSRVAQEAASPASKDSTDKSSERGNVANEIPRADVAPNRSSSGNAHRSSIAADQATISRPLNSRDRRDSDRSPPSSMSSSLQSLQSHGSRDRPTGDRAPHTLSTSQSQATGASQAQSVETAHHRLSNASPPPAPLSATAQSFVPVASGSHYSTTTSVSVFSTGHQVGARAPQAHGFPHPTGVSTAHSVVHSTTGTGSGLSNPLQGASSTPQTHVAPDAVTRQHTPSVAHLYAQTYSSHHGGGADAYSQPSAGSLATSSSQGQHAGRGSTYTQPSSGGQHLFGGGAGSVYSHGGGATIATSSSQTQYGRGAGLAFASNQSQVGGLGGSVYASDQSQHGVPGGSVYASNQSQHGVLGGSVYASNQSQHGVPGGSVYASDVRSAAGSVYGGGGSLYGGSVSHHLQNPQTSSQHVSSAPPVPPSASTAAHSSSNISIANRESDELTTQRRLVSMLLAEKEAVKSRLEADLFKSNGVISELLEKVKELERERGAKGSAADGGDAAGGSGGGGNASRCAELAKQLEALQKKHDEALHEIETNDADMDRYGRRMREQYEKTKNHMLRDAQASHKTEVDALKSKIREKDRRIADLEEKANPSESKLDELRRERDDARAAVMKLRRRLLEDGASEETRRENREQREEIMRLRERARVADARVFRLTDDLERRTLKLKGVEDTVQSLRRELSSLRASQSSSPPADKYDSSRLDFLMSRDLGALDRDDRYRRRDSRSPSPFSSRRRSRRRRRGGSLSSSSSFDRSRSPRSRDIWRRRRRERRRSLSSSPERRRKGFEGDTPRRPLALPPPATAVPDASNALVVAQGSPRDLRSRPTPPDAVFLLHTGAVGDFIGSGGKRVDELRATSQCTIYMLREHELSAVDLDKDVRCVEVAGPPEGVQMVRNVVMGLQGVEVNQSPAGLLQDSKTPEHSTALVKSTPGHPDMLDLRSRPTHPDAYFRLHSNRVGDFVGKNGVALNSLRTETKCAIFQVDGAGCNGAELVEVAGPPTGVARVRQVILNLDGVEVFSKDEKVKLTEPRDLRSRPAIPDAAFHLHVSAMGDFVGIRGANVAKLRQESECVIWFARQEENTEFEKANNVRLIEVKGPEHGVARVRATLVALRGVEVPARQKPTDSDFMPGGHLARVDAINALPKDFRTRPEDPDAVFQAHVTAIADLIGSGGKNIMELRAKTGCVIWFPEGRGKSGLTSILVKGPPAGVEEVRKFILLIGGTEAPPGDRKLLEDGKSMDAEDSKALVVRSDLQPRDLRSRPEQPDAVFKIHNSVLGDFIGSGGKKVMKLRTDADCVIWFTPQEHQRDDVPSTIEVQGPAQGVAMVRRFVTDLQAVEVPVDGTEAEKNAYVAPAPLDFRSRPENPDAVFKLSVSAVGDLVGTGGRRLESLRKETGCTIWMPFRRDCDPQAVVRTIEVEGPPHGVEIVAKRMGVLGGVRVPVAEKPRAQNGLPLFAQEHRASPPSPTRGYNSSVRYLEFPHVSAGLIIGRGGDRIREIEGLSLCKIKQLNSKDNMRRILAIVCLPRGDGVREPDVSVAESQIREIVEGDAFGSSAKSVTRLIPIPKLIQKKVDDAFVKRLKKEAKAKMGGVKISLKEVGDLPGVRSDDVGARVFVRVAKADQETCDEVERRVDRLLKRAQRKKKKKKAASSDSSDVDSTSSEGTSDDDRRRSKRKRRSRRR